MCLRVCFNSYLVIGVNTYDSLFECFIDSWRASQDLAAESYVMPMGPSAFNPYWSGMQPGMEGYMPPYPGPMPYMGYGLSPLDIPFGGVMPPDPFGAQGYMMPIVPPQRYAVLCFGIFSLLSL